MLIKIRLKVKFNLKRGFLISGFGGLPAVGNSVLWEKSCTVMKLGKTSWSGGGSGVKWEPNS